LGITGSNRWDGFWLGKPIWGINRMALIGTWVSEWADGKLETKWDNPLPMNCTTLNKEQASIFNRKV
jgi:hypothetical protein